MLIDIYQPLRNFCHQTMEDANWDSVTDCFGRQRFIFASGRVCGKVYVNSASLNTIGTVVSDKSGSCVNPKY